MNNEVISFNSKAVRNVNRAMILNLIRVKQPISRASIARATGLNKSTVSSIVADLLKEEIIIEQFTNEPNIGRNPIALSLKLGKYCIGAINIDSSLTRFAIADIDGSILGSSFIDTNSGNPEQFIKCCLQELDKLCRETNIQNLEGLGVSIAGIVDSENLIVDFAPNLGWEDFRIGECIKKTWPGIKILAVENDAKSSALAELWFGTHGIDLSNFVFISIGPGIGTGIVVEKKILNGEFHASGEFGHMVIFEGGELCVCGSHGCWETYASDKATVKRYVMRKHGKINQPIDLMVDDIIALAAKNDEIACEVLTQTGYYLGLGIVNIIKAIDPHAIIVGGRIIQAWDIIYPEIAHVVKSRTFFGKKKNILILPSSLSVRPRLIGAATVAIKEIFDE